MIRELALAFRETERETTEDTAPRRLTDAYVELLFAIAYGLGGDLGAAERTLMTAASLDPRAPERFFAAALHAARARYTLHPHLAPDYRGIARFKWLRLLETSRLLHPRGYVDAYADFSALRQPSRHADWVELDHTLAHATPAGLASLIDALPHDAPEGLVTHAAQRCADAGLESGYATLVSRFAPRITTPYRAVRAGIALGRPDLAERLVPADAGIEAFASRRLLGHPGPTDWTLARAVLAANPGIYARPVLELAGELGPDAIWDAMSQLPNVEDRYSTNSHFCLAVIGFMDAVLTAVLHLRGIDATAARPRLVALA